MTTATLSPQACAPAALPRWMQRLTLVWDLLAGTAEGWDTEVATGHANEPHPVRYRHPRTGQGWDGHGHQPQWLRDAVLCQGYTVDELRRAARA